MQGHTPDQVSEAVRNVRGVTEDCKKRFEQIINNWKRLCKWLKMQHDVGVISERQRLSSDTFPD